MIMNRVISLYYALRTMYGDGSVFEIAIGLFVFSSAMYSIIKVLWCIFRRNHPFA